ncbi:MAG: arginine--tRNA ligase [Candidatus Yanofskybacteria bacterium]|nr:arginine--tRNA ligase [Candidatus Yanofskybacteria bacterium]
MIKRWLKDKIQEYYPDSEFDVLTPPDDKMGDYSVNLAFVLAKKNGTSPAEEGEELAAGLSKDKDLADVFEKIEAVKPGFVNFFLKKEFLQKQLVKIYKKRDSFGKSKIGNGKTVIVEYSSPNIAKPMHIGHLRSTIIGDALANVYEALGYKVIRWNYIGDWGTQFGNLIAAYKLWGNKDDLKNSPFTTLFNLYVRFHNELKNNPDLESRGREEFKKLENDDKENLKLWERIKDLSLKELGILVYPSIGVDVKRLHFKGESDYQNKLKLLIDNLAKNNIAKESEGALIIDLEKYGLPPALLRKSDGTTLYFTRDLASLEDRIQNYHANKILYVVANQQTLHFEQLFAVAKDLKIDGAELVHVKFGMVLGEDGKKLATREGKVVPLQDVVNKIQEKAYGIVKHVKFANKDISEDEAQNIARAVGIGALKYNDLKQHPYSDIVFDWDAMLDFSGNSGPYLQYTYARLANILEKVENQKEGNAALLVEPEEEKVMKRLLEFPEAIEKCVELNTLNGLALYLYELSNDANRFYESVRVLDDDNIERRDTRLTLIQAVATVLKRGLNLLGIEALERI